MQRRLQFAISVVTANDAFKKSNKAKEISEDEYAELQEKLQKITDKYVAMVDKAVEAKTKEIMTV